MLSTQGSPSLHVMLVISPAALSNAQKMETFRKNDTSAVLSRLLLFIKNFPSLTMQSEAALKQMFVYIYAAFIQDK